MTVWEKSANAALVVFAIAAVADIANRNFGAGRPGASRSVASVATPPAVKKVYEVGEAFKPIPGLMVEPGRPTLFLVVRSTCKFCNASAPFYQRLVTDVRLSGAKTSLVGLCLESSEACTKYFADMGVALDRTIGVQSAAVRVTGTPTLILIDRSGKVAAVWVGQLPTEAEREVIDRVTGQVTD